MKRTMMTTVQICLDFNTPGEALDYLSEILGSEVSILDWAYLRIGGQYLYPQEKLISDDYEEGEAFGETDLGQILHGYCQTGIHQH